MQDGHAVAELERLLLLVGHEQGRDADLADRPLQLPARALAQRRIEVRERLVEQQDARRGRERAGERDPLLLAARDLAHPPVLEAGEVHQRQRLGHARRDRRSGPSGARERPKATFSPTVRCGKSA